MDNQSIRAKRLGIALLLVAIHGAHAEAPASGVEPDSAATRDVTATASFDPPADTMDTDQPCEASSRNYFQYYRGLWDEKGPLLNECGLGGLIDFRALQGFDPFGRILSAIKGAVCGAIRDQIHDPFVAMINQPIDQANRWSAAKNNQYGDWIDETARNAADAIYDPSERYNMDSYRIDSFQGNNGSGSSNTGSSTTTITVGGGQSSTPTAPPPPPTYTPPPQEVQEPIQIDSGSNNGGDVELDVNGLFETEQNWTEIYNVYD